MIYNDVTLNCTLPGLILPPYTSSGTCNTAASGAIRYNSTNNGIYVCNGSVWEAANQGPIGSTISNPATSCLQIVQQGAFSSNGLYFISLPSGGIIQQVCVSSTSLGSDGSSSAKVSQSCSAIQTYFGITNAFAYIDSSGSNPPNSATAQYVYCNHGSSEGGNGATVATTALTSCGRLLSLWGLSSGQYYINSTLMFVI